MNSFLVKIYDIIPNGLRLKLGQSKWLKGLRRHFLYNSKGFKTAKVLVERTYGNYKVNFQFVASIKVASKAKTNGIENTILRNSFQLLQKYKPNKTDLIVLDVGSNFGYLASVWADSIASKGQVLAFEPNKNLYNSIQKTIATNLKFKTNLKVFNLAVGSRKGKVKLNASAFSSNTEAMSTALESYEVNMVKLDDFVIEQQVERIDIIKIDVDGIELDILKGAASILKNNESIVIVETNDDARILDFFKNLEYFIYDMKLRPFNDSKILPLNIFCVPKILENDAV